MVGMAGRRRDHRGLRCGGRLTGLRRARQPEALGHGLPVLRSVDLRLHRAGAFRVGRFKEERSFATVGFRPGRSWVQLPVGFLLGSATMAVGILLGLATGQYTSCGSAHTLSGSSALLALLPLILLFILAGLHRGGGDPRLHGCREEDRPEEPGPWSPSRPRDTPMNQRNPMDGGDDDLQESTNASSRAAGSL